jgi:hypothetical protein
MSATEEREEMKSVIVKTVDVAEKEGPVAAENAEAVEAVEEDSNYQIFKLN